MAEIIPGDTIEVAKTVDDGTIWNTATVIRIAHDRLIIIQGGVRRAIPNNPSRYRLSKKTGTIAADHQPAPEKMTREGGAE